MRYPLDDFHITQSFHGIDKNYSYTHYGTDLAAPSGTPIVAPEAGKVIAINSNWKPGGYFGGNFVKIQADSGYVYYMGHMMSTVPSLNGRVFEGQLIGYVGATGEATGPHVHFEVSKDGVMLDAEKLLTKEKKEILMDRDDAIASYQSTFHRYPSEAEIQGRIGKKYSEIAKTERESPEWKTIDNAMTLYPGMVQAKQALIEQVESLQAGKPVNAQVLKPGEYKVI